MPKVAFEPCLRVTHSPHLITWKHEHKMMLISSGGSLNVFYPPCAHLPARQQIFSYLFGLRRAELSRNSQTRPLPPRRRRRWQNATREGDIVQVVF